MPYAKNQIIKPLKKLLQEVFVGEWILSPQSEIPENIGQNGKAACILYIQNKTSPQIFNFNWGFDFSTMENTIESQVINFIECIRQVIESNDAYFNSDFMKIQEDSSENPFINIKIESTKAGIRVSEIRDGWAGGKHIRLNIMKENGQLHRGIDLPIESIEQVIAAMVRLVRYKG